MSINIKVSATTEREQIEVLHELRALIRREKLSLKVKKDAEKHRYLAYIESPMT